MTATSRPSGPFDLAPSLVGRAKALGLSVLYLAMVAGGIWVLAHGLRATGLIPAGGHRHPLSLFQQLLEECAFLASATLALLILAALMRESISRWGFAMTGARRDFPIGLGTGFALMAASLAAIAVMGGAKFSYVAAPLGQIASAAACYALLDLVVGFFEEMAFRSFILVQLSRAFGFWPAAIVTAMLFGLAHGGNFNEGRYGLVVAGLLGFALAYSFRRSGTLWFAIGWHAAYDFAEDYVFGVPDSGSAPPQDSLLHTTMHGPTWLTGGNVGPEASVVTLAALLLLLLMIRFTLPRRDASHGVTALSVTLPQ
jgi:membrane protease YdiL (CAAX protease family)